MRELTKEQKALIEEEVLATYTEHYVLFGGQIHGFRLGATKVLLNPEKYGLTPISNLESYKHQRDFYRNKIRELKGGKSVIDGLEGEFDNDSEIIQS